MQTTGRKGFLLPELTDDNPTPGAVIRETFRTNTTLDDKSTFFSDDEQITGKWEFVEAIVADKGQALFLLNNSGGARVSGDVVMLDPAVDQAFILPNAAQVDASKVLIVAEAVAGGAIGRCTLLGITRVKAAPGTLRGRYLQTQNGSTVALGNTNITPGSFGYSLTGLDVNNTVLAAVHAGGAGGGLEISEVDAFPDVVGARQIIFPNGSVTDLGGQVVSVSFGSSILRREQYIVTGTTRALTLVPDTLLSVKKNGLGQTIGTDVTLAGQTLTFTTPLSADVIEIIYMVTNSFNPSSAPYVQEFDPIAGATYVDLMNVPTVIMMVARNGVPQSMAKGDWSWVAATNRVTFSDVFTSGEHVIITWAQNFGGGNAATVNNLPAVPSTAPAANSLVATDAGGQFPLSTLPAIARTNQLVNGSFDNWQRGNGPFTGVTSNRVPTADRWMLVQGTPGTVSVSRDAANQDIGALFCAAITQTGVGGTSDLRQEFAGTTTIEALAYAMRGKLIAVTMRVKTTVANAIRIQINDGIVFTNSAYHSGSGAYETLSATLLVSNGAGSLNLTTNITNAGTFYVCKAMVAVSPYPVDYLPLHPADSIARCLRYYEKIGPSPNYPEMRAYNAAGQSIVHTIMFAAKKAVVPTLTVGGTFVYINGSAATAFGPDVGGFVFGCSVTATGDAAVYSASSGYITAEANP